MWDRLKQNWVYGGFLAGLLLLLLLPIIGTGWPLPLTLVFLQLPLYMLHQYEEHDDDRFHRLVNAMFAPGRDVLPSGAIFLINIPGVWGLNLVSFALASSQGIGWGLIGIYTTLANALLHIGQAIALRRYNPGLVTAIVLFLPAGIAATWAVNASTTVTLTQQFTAIAVAILIHAAIVLYVRGNVRRLSSKQVP